MPPAIVRPFSLDAVREICSAEPTKPLEECAICSKIPGYVSSFEKGGKVEHDDIPMETRKLRRFLDYGYRIGVASISRCPVCRRIYHLEHSHEYYVNGSEDSRSFERTTADKIVAQGYWRSVRTPAELHFDGETWSVVEQKQQQQG